MIKHILLVSFYSAALTVAMAQPTDSIQQNFLNPPNAARPRVWWHWMNGNITKDGIRKDLEWMHRAGIGGFQNFDAAMETPQIVPSRLVYMSPEWKDAFAYTTKLADSLKLEMAIAGSPGWSESGGSWVPKEDGMKKIVWTETLLEEGAGNIPLPRAAASSGLFQNLPLSDGLTNGGSMPVFYKDVAVIAVPVSATDKTMQSMNLNITSSGGSFDLYQLTDGDLEHGSMLPPDPSGKAWIQFSYPNPETIKAITIVGGGDRGFMNRNGDLSDSRAIEASEDGRNFRPIAFLPAGDVLQQTFDIPATTAKYFRVTIQNLPAGRDGSIPGNFVTELVLHTANRVHRFEDKAAFAPSSGLLSAATPESNDATPENTIINLTDKLSPDGTLHWTAPAGKWRILRFGYTVMGITNHPATAEATGFEVDKLDPAAIRRYFTHYLDRYQDATGGLMGSKGGLQFMVNDSWEAGAQNWTAKMPEEFEKRRRYSILPWMPVLAGYIVKSPEASDRFLFDFRKTISEMVAEYHYDQLTEILASYGMKRYTESHESGRQIITDGMDVKRRAAVPMSAMWTKHPYFNQNDQTSYEADVRESASVAHIYGQNLVAAESLTTFGYGGYAWNWSPENLKPTADLELASGLNRFVIHTSPHQPVDDKIPGLGLGPFGQWFDRHDTWAQQAKAWTDYLARSSYLLQQGKFVADIAYYYGEDDNITSLFKKKLPAVPEGYSYDFVNSDALLNLLSVKDGKIVTPSGMNYSVLVLDSNARRIPLKVLQKINQLIKDGATVAGVKPEHSAGLMDNDQVFQKLVGSWSGTNILTGQPMEEALRAAGLSPDFTYKKPSAEKALFFIHRKLTDRDIYWVNSRNDKAQTIEATFRITGKVPELWHPETGQAEEVSYRIAKGNTTVTLPLSPNDAVFVVFKEKAGKTEVVLPAKQQKTIATIEGSWQLSFQKDRGAPETATFNELQSFTENSNPGIKYFSGTATYTRTITIQKEWLASGRPLVLDLGEVKNIAEVELNGKALGTLWKKPFSIDLKNVAKAGENKLVIKVTNLWVNRLIGDQQPGTKKKITYTTQPFYDGKAQLLPSGLLGPVQLISESR